MPSRVPGKGRTPAPNRGPTRAAAPGGQVYICGLGLRLPHLTIETLQALKSCRTVYHSFMDERSAAHVRALCPDLRDLRGLCDAYNSESITRTVLSATAPGSAIAFLNYGHPLVFHGDVLVQSCKDGKAPYRIFPAVSSLDEILVAIGTPVMGEGLQILPSYELGKRRSLQLLPFTPALIMSINHLWDPAAGGVKRFVKYLCRIYPASHPVLLVCCSNVTNNSALRRTTTLARLAAELEKLTEPNRHTASLFIPSLEQAAAGSPGPARSDAHPKEQLLLCGLGPQLRHLTLETLQALRKCDALFHDFLDKKTAAYFKTVCPDLRDLRKICPKGGCEAMARAVLAAAVPGRLIAFLGSGHPMATEGTAEVLLRRCAGEAIPFRAITALTALDEILVAVGIPALSYGMQIYPAHVAAGPRAPLSQHSPAIILQLNRLWESQGCGVEAFVGHLIKVYPPGFKISLIRNSPAVNTPPLRTEMPLGALAAALKKLHKDERPAAALFIPLAWPRS